MTRSADITMPGSAPSSTSFGFDYEFKSSTDAYRAGEFDATLLKMLARFDKPSCRSCWRPCARSAPRPIRPSCRSTRRRGSSCRCRSRRVDVEAGTITWTDPATKRALHHAGDRRPCQAAMEARLGDALGRARRRLRDGRQGPDRLGQGLLADRPRASTAAPPEGFNYELFLDEQGQKISKSKGNGLTIEDWLSYGPPESLALFMYSAPARGQEAALRRDPTRGRRLPAVPRRL